MKTIHTINLIPTRKVQTQGILGNLSRSILFISVVALLVFVISYIGSFIVLSYYTIRLSEFTRKSNEMIERIEAKRDLEAILLTEKDKLTRIEKIISAKLAYTKLLNDVDLMLTPGTSLTNLDISTDGTLTADLMASSSADLAVFVDNLEERDMEKTEYVAFNTSSLKRTETGGYSFSLQFEVKNKQNGKIE